MGYAKPAILALYIVLTLGVPVGVKLLLFLYCYSLRKRSSQVQVLWEDHRNDLWINGFGMGPCWRICSVDLMCTQVSSCQLAVARSSGVRLVALHIHHAYLLHLTTDLDPLGAMIVRFPYNDFGLKLMVLFVDCSFRHHFVGKHHL